MSNAPDITLIPDLHVGAVTVLLEARGEPTLGQVAVAQAIKNRATDLKSRWPRTWRGVCTQDKQFSCWNVGDPNRTIGLQIVTALAHNGPLGKYGDPFRGALWLVEMVDAGHGRDVVKGANHYHRVDVAPWWSKGLKPVVIIGNHMFFTL